MTEVLSPPTSSTSASPSSSPQPPTDSADLSISLPRRPAPRERIPSYAQSRISSYSQQSRASRSRSVSTAAPFPAFQSSLAYTVVRDFAWPIFHPLRYGAPDAASGATTPGSEWQGGGRPLSDPMDVPGSAGTWGAGPWGDAGVMYSDPEQKADNLAHDPLPSTSFACGDEGSEAGDETGGGVGVSAGGGKRKHRKSKSYANITDFERGRRRESAGYHHCSRASGEAAQASEMFMFLGQQSDPAGRESLRQSRGYGEFSGPGSQPATENGGAGGGSSRARADSHFQTMLPNRSYPSARRASQQQDQQPQSQLPQPPGTPFDPDTTMPLDTEPPTHQYPHHTIRSSLGPEDEELYAGRSLALYPFEPENSNELRLREGQVIMVSYRHGQGWLVAEDPESGEQGLVPEEYVRLLSELPHFDEERGVFLEEEGDGEVGDGGHEEEESGEDAEEDVGMEGDDDEETEGVGGEGGRDAVVSAAGMPAEKGKERETRVDTPGAYEVDAGEAPPPPAGKLGR